MILGVMEGQIRGGYFPDCILDPSVIDSTAQLHGETKEILELNIKNKCSFNDSLVKPSILLYRN